MSQQTFSSKLLFDKQLPPDGSIIVVRNKEEEEKLKSLLERISEATKKLEQTEVYSKYKSLRKEIEKFQHYPLHKIIAASKSDVFKTAFSGTSMREGRTGIYVLQDNDPETLFPLIVSYMYTGNITFNQHNVVQLLAFCQRLAIKDLGDAIKKYLNNTISFSNAIFFLKKALNFEPLMLDNERTIEETCINLIAQQPDQHINEIYNLPLEVIMKILSSKKLSVSAGKTICKLVLGCIDTMKNLSKEQVLDLLNHVSFVPEDEASKMLEIAKKYGAEKLKNLILAQHLDINTDLSFMSKEEFVELLSQPTLNVPSEFALYSVIKNHADKIKGLNSEDLTKLQKSILIEWLDSKELETVFKDGFIPQNILAKHLMNISLAKVVRDPRRSYAVRYLLPITKDLKDCKVVLSKGPMSRTVHAKVYITMSTKDNTYAPITNVSAVSGWVTYNGSPFCGDNAVTRYQCLYKAEELNKVGICSISGLQFGVTAGATQTLDKLIIGIGTTKDDTLKTWVKTDICYGPKSVTGPSTFQPFIFAKPYEWDMSSNIVIEVAHTVQAPSGSGNANRYNLTGRALKGYSTNHNDYNNLSKLNPVTSNEVIQVKFIGKAKTRAIEFLSPKGFTPTSYYDGENNVPIEKSSLQQL